MRDVSIPPSPETNRSTRKKLFALLTLCFSTAALVGLTGVAPTEAATHSYTGSANAVHMQLKSGENIVCFKYGTSDRDRPVASGCPTGTFTEQLFDINWRQIGGNKTAKVGGDTSGSTGGTHEGSANAVHMQLKSGENIVCFKYGTSDRDRPVASGCPTGTFTEQLFDTNWKQIGGNKSVTVGGGGDGGGPSNPGTNYASHRNNESQFKKMGTGGRNLNNTRLASRTAYTADDAGRYGNFRVSCVYSHFNYDDPILHPGGQNDAHLHMFFGNTRTNYQTTESSLVSSGGGSCAGFELNRSAYWTPAVKDGKGNAVVPESIVLYYKTSTEVGDRPEDVIPIPSGLKMVAGRFDKQDEFYQKGGDAGSDYRENEHLFWSCGRSGFARNKKVEIPADCGNDPVNATIYFPECWDGVNKQPVAGKPHVAQVGPGGSCPDEYPKRMPRLGILLYFKAGQSTAGWTLSSDMGKTPGSTLHADFIAGWEYNTIKTWVAGCMHATENCDLGETGAANRRLVPPTPSRTYTGPDRVKISTIPR